MQIIEINKKLNLEQQISDIICNTFIACESDAYKSNLELVQKFVEGNSPEKIMESFNNSIYFGAIEDDKLLGIIRFLPNKNKIGAFFVDKNHLRLGIGRKLFNSLLTWCKDNMIKVITVWSSVYAVEIYKKLGFVQIGDLQQTTDGIKYIELQMKLKE